MPETTRSTIGIQMGCCSAVPAGQLASMQRVAPIRPGKRRISGPALVQQNAIAYQNALDAYLLAGP